MANDSEKRYRIVDHADKLGDRVRVNPNRAARLGVAHRWPAASIQPASGAATVSDAAKKKR